MSNYLDASVYEPAASGAYKDKIDLSNIKLKNPYNLAQLRWFYLWFEILTVLCILVDSLFHLVCNCFQLSLWYLLIANGIYGELEGRVQFHQRSVVGSVEAAVAAPTVRHEEVRVVAVVGRVEITRLVEGWERKQNICGNLFGGRFIPGPVSGERVI